MSFLPVIKIQKILFFSSVIIIFLFFSVVSALCQFNDFPNFSQNKFLVYSLQEIAIGSFKQNKFKLNSINLSVIIEDIHNCSYSKKKNLIVLAVSNRQLGQHELLLINPDNGLVKSLMRQKVIYYVAISSSGRNIVLTAPPTKEDNSVSLYLYDLRDGTPHLLIKNGVNRLSIPSWCSDEEKVVYHDINNNIVVINIYTKEKRIITTGEFPVFSPTNSNKIAYIKDGEINIQNLINRDGKAIFHTKWFWQSEPFGQLSWSNDGKFIIFSRATGLTGYKTAFYVINIENKKSMKIYEGYFKGLLFM